MIICINKHNSTVLHNKYYLKGMYVIKLVNAGCTSHVQLIHLSVWGPRLRLDVDALMKVSTAFCILNLTVFLFYTFVQFRLALCVSWLQHSQGFTLDKYLDNSLNIVCKPPQEILMF